LDASNWPFVYQHFFFFNFLIFKFQQSGSITYNGHKLEEFCVQRTAAYISQTDDHIPELTVRETLDFAARCQGASEGFAGLFSLS
jgi:ABC-type multidrug transport system ATPase subunit